MVTVQMIIDKLVEPVGEFQQTTDRLIVGNPDQKVSRVGVTFSTSYESIREAARLNVDLLITHEPTFYSHSDETEWLIGDEVFETKQQLIQESGMAIYRFHDYWHRYQPDGILRGFINTMGWDLYARAEHPYVIDIPPATVSDVASELKLKLGVSGVQLIGNPNQPVSVLALSPGFQGGKRQITKLMKHKADLLIVGETHTWETNEYVQDAVAMGFSKAMLVIGHMASEEAGMKQVLPLLESFFPELEVNFIPGNPHTTWI